MTLIRRTETVRALVPRACPSCDSGFVAESPARIMCFGCVAARPDEPEFRRRKP